MNDIIPQKRCTRCLQEFPATSEYFTRDRGRLCSHCKQCRKLDRKEDRAINGDKIRGQNRASSVKHQDRIKAYQHQWNIDNRERLSLEAHEYYLEHRDEIIARVKQYYQDNKEERKAYIRQWQIDNPDKMRVYRKNGYQKHRHERYLWAKEYRQNNIDRYRAYARASYASNPDRDKARRHRRRALILASQDGHFTADDVKLQYKSQRGKCWHCGKSVGEKYHIDHLYPLVLGGSNGARNIVVSCEPCNLSKGAKPTWEWNGRLL